MDKQTLKALKGSIKKWQKIVDGTGTDKGVDNCPLCELFWYSPNFCDGCPVAERTGRPECEGTPYRDYRHAVADEDGESPKTYAVKELEFLKSLLPGEQDEKRSIPHTTVLEGEEKCTTKSD